MTSLPNSQWQTNPLLKTQAPTPLLAPAPINAPGAMQYRDGGQATMIPPTITTTPTAPVATPPMPTGNTTSTAQPNIQSELDRIKKEALGIQSAINQLPQEPTIQQSFAAPTPDQFGDPSVEAYLRNLATNPVDEESIRQAQMRMFQQQIDATNQIYSGLMQEAQFQGQGRLGSQRAISARSGLLGSDFGASQKETVMDYNRQIERGIAAEQAAKIAAIMGEARSSAATEIREKNQARMQGADAYLKYLAGARERKASNLQKLAGAMLEQGASPFDMDEQTLKEIAQQYGTTIGDIQSTFQTFKSQSDAEAEANLLKRTKTEAEINKLNMEIEKGQWQSIGEGTMLINPTTGERIKNPKTYAPTVASGLKIGGKTLDQEAVADVHNILQETRGSDGYANTGTYMRELEGFVALGGDPKDFIKEYNPDIYINPNDPSRSFLQSQMRKPASDNLFLGALGGIDIGSAIAEASSGN
jgi:hypothetical protein